MQTYEKHRLNLTISPFKWIALLASLLFLSAYSLAASTEQEMTRLFGASQPYIDFFHKFQNAVNQNDKETVAAEIRYPLTVSINNKRTQVKTKSDFLARYDEIMSKKVIASVAKQDLSNIFLNSKGVMFGNGEVWYSGICIDKECDSVLVKVIAINP